MIKLGYSIYLLISWLSSSINFAVSLIFKIFFHFSNICMFCSYIPLIFEVKSPHKFTCPPKIFTVDHQTDMQYLFNFGLLQRIVNYSYSQIIYWFYKLGTWTFGHSIFRIIIRILFLYEINRVNNLIHAYHLGTYQNIKYYRIPSN